MNHGQVAQSVEQRTENPRVGGSIPSLATTPRNCPRRRPLIISGIYFFDFAQEGAIAHAQLPRRAAAVPMRGF